MSDDTIIPPEDMEEEDTQLVFQAEPTAPIFTMVGNNSCMVWANPESETSPFSWIKGCVGASVYMKPGSQAPDDIRYVVMVGDGFELRELTECLNAGSDKEYTPIKRLKSVN